MPDFPAKTTDLAVAHIADTRHPVLLITRPGPIICPPMNRKWAQGGIVSPTRDKPLTHRTAIDFISAEFGPATCLSEKTT